MELISCPVRLHTPTLLFFVMSAVIWWKINNEIIFYFDKLLCPAPPPCTPPTSHTDEKKNHHQSWWFITFVPTPLLPPFFFCFSPPDSRPGVGFLGKFLRKFYNNFYMAHLQSFLICSCEKWRSKKEKRAISWEQMPSFAIQLWPCLAPSPQYPAPSPLPSAPGCGILRHAS